MSDKTFKLSPSSLGLMQKCQRCFWLDKHNVWKRPRAPFSSLPNGMDLILKSHFDKFRDRNELPPELSENGHTKEMKLFEDEPLLIVWRDAFKGIQWKDPKGNILMGAVDNLLTNGKKIVVLDYKTKGFPAKENDHIYSQHQLDIYNFLLRKNGYDTEDFALLLFYFPSNVTETGEFIFDTELRKVRINSENAEKLFNRAINLLNSECPDSGCEWCQRF